MKTFYCLNGEKVLVEDFTKSDTVIYIHYKGKRYQRSKEVIGKTILPKKRTTQSTKTVCKGDTVLLKRKNGSVFLTVKLCDTHIEKTYRRMGGAYYGNSTDCHFIGDEYGNQGGVQRLSDQSPIGKAVIGKKEGENVSVYLPDNTLQEYIILRIEK